MCFHPGIKQFQKFRIMSPKCPICTETCIDRIIEDYGHVKYVRFTNGVNAWITRSHKKEFTDAEKSMIERDMQKRIGTPLMMWNPDEPLRHIHAYAYVLNTRVTKGMIKISKIAQQVIKD